MQSMFRLPWSSDAPGDKIMEKATLHKARPLPVVDIPNFMTKMKRKRTDSPEPASPQHAQVLKKWKSAQGEVKPAAFADGGPDRMCVVDGMVADPARPVEARGTSNVASADVLDARPKAQPASREGAAKSRISMPENPAAKSDAVSPNDHLSTAATMESDLTSVQQAIEAQFNYEILLKHNELRLIEQELAKCQVSLEQLRRCSLIPFPGTEGFSQDVSSGLGHALQPPSGYTEPQHAAPWGVTDGPYTRHYAKWLIPDPKFDPIPERMLAQQSQGYFGYGLGEGRTTRGSFAEFGSTGKARTSRTSTGTLKLQALGENPTPAPKIDPLLHKRSTDGQWVRLYCAQCGHSNFSNTQGFLNHCRIKHNQVFKSHDQAAIACGVPVDINESGNPVTATEPASTTVTTPAATFPVPTTPGFVHPLVRTNPTELAKGVHRDFTPRDPKKTLPPTPKADFTKAPSTPHLNSLLAKRGFEGNLKGLVETARTKVDLSVMETSDDDGADSATQTPIAVKPSQQLARLPASAPNVAPASKAPSARPGSKKGQSTGHARLPHFPPPVNVNGHVQTTGLHMPDSPIDLSPNTVESNPGLVSDHDDDDDEDGYDARSQPDIIMHGDDDIVVEDASDVEGVAERTGSRKGLEGCFEKAGGEGSRKH
jgi:ADA HAT complex component 1